MWETFFLVSTTMLKCIYTFISAIIVIKSAKLPCYNVFVCVCTNVGLLKLTFKAHKFFLLQGYHEPFGDKALREDPNMWIWWSGGHLEGANAPNFGSKYKPSQSTR